MKLSALIAELNITAPIIDREVTCITDNSAKICPGCIFVCIKGARFDGHTKAAEALESGAAAVVVSHDMELENQLIVDDTRKAYTLLCSAFKSHPERNLKLIGITGTNGKTTTAFIIREALEKLGHKTGMIGTVQNNTGDRVLPASLTTPDPNELFNLFDEMVKSGCEYCVMEVSSQALHQQRVAGIHYKAAVFTNLTQDHLDYHGSFENYMAAKHILFENSDIGIFNIDDDASEYMMNNSACHNVTYSLSDNNCNYSAKDIRSKASGVKYEIVSDDNIGRISFRVPGEFSVYNSMGAAVCLIELGMDFRETTEAISCCSGIPGRMETLKLDKPYTIIIDYAHTPDGLENVLKSLKSVAEGKVIAVFGCGGDRDKTKRPIMGEIGASLSDIAIITSDNPRSEDPKAIIDDITAGVPKGHKSTVYIEIDRTQAIRKAISLASENDIILLAGKGHETYQILSTGKIHYDEREIVAEILK